MVSLDEDALIAGIDMIGRTGAKCFEVGHLEDEDSGLPIEQLRWYAHAEYRGSRIFVEEKRGRLDERLNMPSPRFGVERGNQ